jgi:hypothetical protein
LRQAVTLPNDSDPSHLSGISSVDDRLRELFGLCLYDSGGEGDSGLICSSANSSLVADFRDLPGKKFGGEQYSNLIAADSLLIADFGDPLGEESASDVCFSRLLHITSCESDVSRYRRGAALLKCQR